MAQLTTTVRSPRGAILVLPNRVPRNVAIEKARIYLQRQIIAAQEELEIIDTWTTTAERGSVAAKTYEEFRG